MIEKSISAPGTGFGVRQFISLQAKEAGFTADQIAVVVAAPELGAQWEQIAPGVQAITYPKWMRNPTTDRKLIIVDEMRPQTLMRIMQSLHDAVQPVWLTNNRLPIRADWVAPFADLTITSLIESGCLVRKNAGPAKTNLYLQQIGRAMRKPDAVTIDFDEAIKPKSSEQRWGLIPFQQIDDGMGNLAKVNWYAALAASYYNNSGDMH